ncbi:MAG: DUF58 domain-containing protein [Planctomycetes bacterium]|nr:DUF58 domain-containing protein [Planctomycetota bacterium]
MTTQGLSLMLPALVGLLLGVVRGQTELALLSLSVLVWMVAEWSLFTWRVWFELPRIEIERTVNGRREARGLLWAGRTVTVHIQVTMTRGTNRLGASLGPTVLFRDVMPDNMEVLSSNGEWDGNQFALRTRSSSVSFGYTARVRAAGLVELPGVRVSVQDGQGFFLAERFLRLPQSFRVLPAFADAGDARPLVKRTNAIPQHGIHRLQRSGMGSELLELRDYVAGDPPKSIAWKVSARRGKLMTRQYESEVPVRVQLFIDGSIGTRIGGYGRRLLDQMLYVGASVARSAISVGDPVGATLLDERDITRLPPLAGERGFHRLLEAMAEFSADLAPPPVPLSPALLQMALKHAADRHPELLDRRVNQTPATLFPILPFSRRRFRQRCLLAGVMTEVFQLSNTDNIGLIHDDGLMARYAQRFLMRCGLSWMEPVVVPRGSSAWIGLRMETLADALVRGVTHARDNEVFVVFAELHECVPGLSTLLPAVKMALGRHHRVAFVCPSPTFRRPTPSSTDPQSDSVDDLVAAAEQIRTRDLILRLQRELRRIGATVTCSGEKEAVQMILSEMELARTGRLSPAGAH